MITAEHCAERVGTVLREQYGERRNAVKHLARRLNQDPRAVKNYFYGTNAPPMHNLVQLLAECDELKDEVLRLVAELRERRG